MTHEVTVTDRVLTEIDGLPRFDQHIAIPAVEPLDAVIFGGSGSGRKTLRVYGFTAGGTPVVMAHEKPKLVPLTAAMRSGEHAMLQSHKQVSWEPIGPFIPAPAGMTAVFNDGRRLPVVYYDVHGRPVCVDDGPRSRVLLAIEEDDEGLVGFEGLPAEGAPAIPGAGPDAA